MGFGAFWGCNKKPIRQSMTILFRVLISLWWGLTNVGIGIAQEWPPAVYSAKEIRVTVVEAETGKPLEGAIVVAQWVLFMSNPVHGDHGPRLYVTEAITNAEGKLYIPGWGPKPNPRYPFTSLIDRDPMLSFLKPGFRPLVIQNRWDRNDSVRFSEWDGKTIKLERFIGTDAEWAKELTIFQGWLAWGWKEVMDWRWMPRTVLAVEQERQKLEQKRVYVLGFTPSPLDAFGTSLAEVRRFVEGQK
jgi:hypothetical protein